MTSWHVTLLWNDATATTFTLSGSYRDAVARARRIAEGRPEERRRLFAPPTLEARVVAICEDGEAGAVLIDGTTGIPMGDDQTLGWDETLEG